jgi:glycosyltransferase involved in cell wall biosynthesis
MKVAFVTNICPHYRVKTYELLARHHDVDYFFFSAGKDWYWEQNNGVHAGNFKFVYLPGFQFGGTRFTPSLITGLWQGRYEVYIKCINGRFALPITYLIARLRKKPFILTTDIWMRLQTIFHRLIYPVTRYIYRHSDAIVAYGEHVRRFLVDEGVSAERIFVAPHAIDNRAYNRLVTKNEKAALFKKLNIGPGKKVILYLGRLEEAKGLSYLVEAIGFLKRKDVILILAGEGSFHLALEKLVLEKDIMDQVRFTGYVPPDETVVYYSTAVVLVLPSITTPTFKEPWGLVINEAFNQGVPVITTEAVGAAAGGLVVDGFNGFVVKERDAVALALTLNKILDDSNLRTRLSQNASSCIASRDNERMVLGFRAAIDYVTRSRV